MLINEIKTKNWQQKLGDSSQIVEDIADLEQCISIAVSTRKGSIPHDPNWGNGAFDFLDMPENIAVPNIIKETIECIDYCVKRVKIVSCNILLSNGACTLTLAWQLSNNDETRNLEVIIK